MFCVVGLRHCVLRVVSRLSKWHLFMVLGTGCLVLRGGLLLLLEALRRLRSQGAPQTLLPYQRTPYCWNEWTRALTILLSVPLLPDLRSESPPPPPPKPKRLYPPPSTNVGRCERACPPPPSYPPSPPHTDDQNVATRQHRRRRCRKQLRTHNHGTSHVGPLPTKFITCGARTRTPPQQYRCQPTIQLRADVLVTRIR